MKNVSALLDGWHVFIGILMESKPGEDDSFSFGNTNGHWHILNVTG